MNRITVAILFVLLLCIVNTQARRSLKPRGQKSTSFPTLPSSKKLNIGTWNVALLPGNVSAAIDQIPRDLDVLALEEVWFPWDADTLKAALASSYPYTYAVPSENNGVVGCKASSQSSITRFEQCLTANNVPYIYWSTITVCADIIKEWINTDYDCLSCYLALTVDGDTDATTKCMAGQGYPYLFGGSTGMMVLSKKPITKPTFAELPSFLLRAGVATFCVDGVYIAHSHFPFNWTYNHNQDWIDVKEYLQTDFALVIEQLRPQVVLGDFNSGPNYQPDGYNNLIDAGYTPVDEGYVTFCADPTVGGCPYENPEDVQLKIDHIFIDSDASRNNLIWERTNRLSVATFSTPDPYVSDHLGLRARLQYVKLRDHPACRL